MHSRGINTRFLGIILNNLPNPTSSLAGKTVMTAMVCRAAKMSLRALLRKSMKSIVLANDEPYIRITIDYFNLLFGNSSDSRTYWKTSLSETLELNFFYLQQSKVDLERLKSQVDLKEMFHLLIQLNGIVLSPRFLAERDLSKTFQLKRFISESDIIGMEPVAKQPRSHSKPLLNGNTLNSISIRMRRQRCF